MIHTKTVVGLALAALVMGNTTASCEPTPKHPAHATVPRHQDRADQCDTGWVCGTCPDGNSWAYLDDLKYTNDKQLSVLFFDNKHPCG